MKKIKTNKAITLVALIITIVVLLILATVTIKQASGEKIVEQAKNAEENTETEIIKKQIKKDILSLQATKNTAITEDNINVILSNYGTVTNNEEGRKLLKTSDNKYTIDVTDIISEFL